MGDGTADGTGLGNRTIVSSLDYQCDMFNVYQRYSVVMFIEIFESRHITYLLFNLILPKVYRD